VPVGGAGEICIGGRGLAFGYLNREQRTREKFIEDRLSGQPGGRLYRSGDVGRWLSDGTLEYMGRLDEQVKVGGYRIELGEIERVLELNDQVLQSVVVARKDAQGNNRLMAYIVAAKSGSLDVEELRVYLAKRLPRYLIPVLIRIDQLAFTASGKIDRQTLPDPKPGDIIQKQYVAPRNAIEKALAQIWSELLGVEKVGIDDNFFELGGHSLLAIRAVSLMQQEMQTEFSVKLFFDLFTIRSITTYLRVKLKAADPAKRYKEIKL
jgi:hypothetical protein